MTFEETSIAEHATRDVLAIGVEDDCRRASVMMRVGGIGRLPVLDGDRLVGIITEGDIHRRAPRAVPLESVRVGGVMTYSPMALSPDVPVREAVRLLLLHDVGAFPVIRDGHLEGMFSRSNALDALLGSHTAEPLSLHRVRMRADARR